MAVTLAWILACCLAFIVGMYFGVHVMESLTCAKFRWHVAANLELQCSQMEDDEIVSAGIYVGDESK
jgi:hypothetical protein